MKTESSNLLHSLIAVIILMLFIGFIMHDNSTQLAREAGQWEQYTQVLREENAELENYLNDTLHDNLELQIKLYGKG